MAEEAVRIALAQAQKQAKTDHVSGHSGGSVWEVNALCTVAPAAVFFWSVLQSRYRFFESPSNRYVAVAVDFLLNVVAILAATTVYADSLGLLLGLLVLPAAGLYLTTPPASASSSSPNTSSSSSWAKARASFAAANATAKDESSPSTSLPPVDFPIRPYLSAYRAGMMVCTAVCILAVDFNVFPRRFAKVETWGTSLMDIGVGSFVFSGGLIASRQSIKARMAASSTSTSSSSSSPSRPHPSFLSNLLNALRSSLPLQILGFARLLSVKSVDYAEHTSEYGVHWNFFFTLGCLPIGMALFIDPILARLPRRLPAHLILGLLVTLLHGLALDLRLTHLRTWVLTAPRVDLLSQNREGVVSLAGYLAIFLFGMETGGALLPRNPVAGLGALISQGGQRGKSVKGGKSNAATATATSHRRNTLILLAAGACVYGALAWLLVNPIAKGFNAPGPPVSRRLANPPYVLWIVSFNHLQLFLYALVEALLFPAASGSGDPAAASQNQARREASRATSDILAAYNSGGLAIFLVTNLGTGLVNLTVDTLAASREKAMGILLVYMIVCTACALGIAKSGLKLKI